MVHLPATHNEACEMPLRWPIDLESTPTSCAPLELTATIECNPTVDERASLPYYRLFPPRFTVSPSFLIPQFVIWLSLSCTDFVYEYPTEYNSPNEPVTSCTLPFHPSRSFVPSLLPLSLDSANLFFLSQPCPALALPSLNQEKKPV